MAILLLKKQQQQQLFNHTINYELPTTGKISNVLTGSQAENKIGQGIEQTDQTVKQRLVCLSYY